MDIKELLSTNSEYYQDFVSRMTYHTNAIEGNTLTLEQTRDILKGKSSIKEQERFFEYNEILNHKNALDYVINALQEPISERAILDIGKIINKNILDISSWRNTDVYIRGSKHIPPRWGEIRERMMYYVYNYNKTKVDDIFLFMANMHIGFERIHPFQDGNGRTGRLLLAKESIKNNIPSAIIRYEDREEYIAMLEARDDVALAKLLERRSQEELECIKKFL